MAQIKCKKCGKVRLTISSDDPEFIKTMEDEMNPCWYCKKAAPLKKTYGTSEEIDGVKQERGEVE